MKILTITGYKPMELNIFKHDDARIAFVKGAIEKRLIDFAEKGLEWVLISGQMGVELWAGEVVLDMQERYPIKLAVIPPFENQESRWPEQVQLLYQELLAGADFYKPLYKGDYQGAYQFQAKNMWLVDKSDGCLMLFDEEFPGSNRFFHEAAEKAGDDYPIYLITPADLDEIVEETQMMNEDY